jgi:hypothetical protein
LISFEEGKYNSYNSGTLLVLGVRRTTTLNEMRSFGESLKIKSFMKEEKKFTRIPHYISSFPEMLRS